MANPVSVGLDQTLSQVDSTTAGAVQALRDLAQLIEDGVLTPEAGAKAAVMAGIDGLEKLRADSVKVIRDVKSALPLIH